MPQKLANLSEYIPSFMSDFDILKRFFSMSEPEFRLLWALIEKVHNNKRPETSDSHGIYDWETMLKMNHEGELSLRKEKVILRMARNNRYTLNYFLQLLDAFAPHQSYELDISQLYSDFILKLKITLPMEGDFLEVRKIVSHEGVVPSHISIVFELEDIEEFTSKHLGALVVAFEQEVKAYEITPENTGDGVLLSPITKANVSEKTILLQTEASNQVICRLRGVRLPSEVKFG